MDSYQYDESAAQAFCGALQRTLRVAGRNDEGEREALSKKAVSERLDIHRDTLASYLTEEGAGRATLRTITEMAEMLGIPPAFLLMRRQDWVMLITSFGHLTQIVSQNNGEAIFGPAGSSPSRSLNPVASADIGLQLASLMGVGPAGALGRNARETAQLRQSIEDRIATNCALPPYTKLTDEQAAFLLALCALIGSRPQPLQEY